MLTLDLSQKPEVTYEEFQNGVAFLSQQLAEQAQLYPAQRIAIRFREPAAVRVNRRGDKRVTEIAANFWTSKGGLWCYSLRTPARTGYPVRGHFDYRKASAISIRTRAEIDADGASLRAMRGIAHSIHPNAWDDLRARILADPQHYVRNYGTGRVSLRSKFPEWVVARVRQAFEAKEDFSYRTDGKKRDLSVEMKTCSDGIYRAWFSSLYAGTCNGSFYLLLNGSTAALREDD